MRIRDVASRVVLPLLILGIPATGQAQTMTRQRADDVPATFVLVEKFQYPDAAAVVLRRTEESPADILVLPRAGATEDLLAAAAFVLLQVRRLSGDVPQEPAVYRVANDKNKRGVDRRTLPRARPILKELARQETTYIEGVGNVQAVTVWFPATGLSER